LVLFWPRGENYLDELYKALLSFREARADIPRRSEESGETFKEIAAFYKRFPKLTSPYMKMDQKAPRF